MKHYNTGITSEFYKMMRLKGENAPDDMEEFIQPTFDVNPRSKVVSVVESASATNTASTTVYTTPVNQDFYLTFASLQMKASAGVANSPLMSLTVVIDGIRKALLQEINIPNLGTVTGPISIFTAGNNPIKLDRNTTVTLVMSAPSANDMIGGTIAGFVLDE